MAEHKITQVSNHPPIVKSFPKDGKTITYEIYKVMFEGFDEPVDITTGVGKAPQPGDVLSGTIEPSDFGFKFKKTPYALPAPTATRVEVIPSTGANSRDKAMYVSYAKDIAVALLESTGWDSNKFIEIIGAVADKGDYMFDMSNLGFAVTKDTEESLEARGRVESVFGKTEIVRNNQEFGQ